MMSQALGHKIDARGRRLLSEGRLAGRVEAFIRTVAPITAEQEQELRTAGVTPYSIRADVLAGAIDGPDSLESVAQLPYVEKIELSRPLYGESPG
jgi:hypothetical protein